MPISYRIHADLGLLVTRYVDVVADDEFIEVYKSILGGSAFRHGFNELADLQELKEFNVTADTPQPHVIAQRPQQRSSRPGPIVVHGGTPESTGAQISSVDRGMG